MDGLLAADPDGNPSAFLSCQSSGSDSSGFWERRVCPDGMVFDFINQQCLQRKHRKQPTLNIAILNNSCAHGETCIGGTVCDLERLRCLCPYGTVPHLETLSCIKPQSSYSSFEGYDKQASPASFLPNPSFTNPPPFTFNFGPLFGKETTPSSNYGNQKDKYINANNAPVNAYSSQSGGNSNHGASGQWSMSGSKSGSAGSGYNGVNTFSELLPKPTQEQSFVFQPNFFASTASPAQTKKVPTLARPGHPCRENEMCIGGSVCTYPIGLCLCPGDLEEKDGECVLPSSATIPIEKVGLGALCSDLAECDHGSTCVMGRCVCVPPMIQHEGRCVLKQERKEVGPGELCDNGEVCVRGSVCDTVIPVCVCPPNTDLSNGDCVHVSLLKKPAAVSNYATEAVPVPQTAHIPSTQLPAQPQPAFVTTTPSAPTYSPPSTQASQQNQQPSPFGGQYGQSQNVYQEKQVTAPAYPAQPSQVTYSNYQSTMPPPTVKTSKPNHMKISLGGSKQSGVGVPCSLNTDCMIGAYCNGNTNPPSCQCLSTHVNIDGRCERVVYPGQIGCRSDLQCSAAYTGTKCVDRICVCPEGYKEVDQTCVPESEPVTSPPGGACSDSRICVGGSICREGWCICPDPTMIVQRGICIQSGPRPTLPPANVISPTPAPDHNQYTIPQGRKIAPGSNCGPLDTCVGGAMCVDGLCVCPSGMQASTQGRCERMSSNPAPSTAMILKPGSVHATELTYQHTHQPQSRPRPPLLSSYSTASSSMLHVTHASTPTLTIANTASEVDECAAIGLYCRGNTVCRNLSCQCPDGFVLHNDGCIPPDEASRHKVLGKARHQGTPTYARPGQQCGNGEVCVGGSVCNEMMVCTCPPEKPVLQGDACVAQQFRKIATPGESCDDNTECTKESTCQAGQCRCQYGYIAVSGQCVALPMPTTPTLKNVVLAKPLNSCDNGEQCEGGSICDQETGVCLCPPGQIVFGTECRPPPQSVAQSAVNSMAQPAQVQTPSYSTANTECVDDTNCGTNKVCVVGRCKCKPGFVDHDGVCEPLEKIELGERPVPVSFAKHKVETLSSERVVEQPEFTESVALPQPRPPSRQETQRPRIVGPPIRRPKPKSKGTAGTTPGSYKTTTGAGACPPGNEPTRDDDGRLILCNGLEPNCPPRSYCYITSGGFATEEYNCCKSW